MNDNIKKLQAILLITETLEYSSTRKNALIDEIKSMIKTEMIISKQ